VLGVLGLVAAEFALSNFKQQKHRLKQVLERRPQQHQEGTNMLLQTRR
jgi:hypothetical protein